MVRRKTAKERGNDNEEDESEQICSASLGFISFEVKEFAGVICSTMVVEPCTS